MLTKTSRIANWPASLLLLLFLFSPRSLKGIMSLTDAPAVDVAQSASISSRRLATLSNSARNEALTALHGALSKSKDAILDANARDVKAATEAAQSGGLSASVLKRLDLSRPGKYDDMLQGILSVRNLDDPGERDIRCL